MFLRKLLIGGAAIVVAAIGALSFTSIPSLVMYGPDTASGLTAELACAGVFVMGRDLDEVMAHDVIPSDPIMAKVTVTLDKPNRIVRASLFGRGTHEALYRPGLGCTLTTGTDIAILEAQAKGLDLPAPAPRPGLWPEGDGVETQPSAELDKAAADAFAETAPAGGKIDTRAIVVVQDGRIVAERYAQGFGATTPLLGWSMSKSVTAALVGTLVADGKLALDKPIFPAAHDNKAGITLDNLLQMESGLAFAETYAPGDDATTMLFARSDMAGYAASRDLIHMPGKIWSYSSGTANMLAKQVTDAAGGGPVAAANYMRNRLFGPAGIQSAVFEPDGSGTFVGSSYLYMTARDWARFGLIYLNDGEIGGYRILPSSWIAFTRTPAAAPAEEKGGYGAQFWLNSGGEGVPLHFPHCPSDMYMAMGHNDQIVAIVPSRRAVIVRLGWTTGGASWDGDRYFSRILAALKP